jgi:Tol biopolymer transport system component
LTGKPVQIAEGFWTARGAGQASFSASHDGVLAYVNESLSNLQLALFDRAGRLHGLVGPAGRYVGTPQLSPDGRRLVIAQSSAGNEHIWLTNLADQSSSRLTVGLSRDTGAVWARDGGRLAYLSASARGMSLMMTNMRDRSEETLLESDRLVSVDDWSPDGRYLVYTTAGPRSYSDLWLLSLHGERRQTPFLQSAFNKTQAQVSPDGKWIAYTSYESGADEIYVEGFPVAGNRRQVSVAGGVQPRWGKGGKELFYVAPDQRLMAVPIRGGPAFETGPAIALFKTRLLPHGSQSIGLRTLYDVSPDGQQFVCLGPPEEAGAPITLVQNWTVVLRRAPVNQP